MKCCEIMDKAIILAIFLVVISINMSAVSAWNWNTHQEIVESSYYSLPLDMQHNLNLELMKKGSTAPDFLFFDFKYHNYPNSYKKAIYWLNEGQNYYKKGDFYYASYCYGVASHYITDSFAAPHAANVGGSQHISYEINAIFLKPEVIQTSGDLNSKMCSGDLNGEKNWNIWLKTRNTSLIQNDLNQATSTYYSVIYSSMLNLHPIEKNNSKTDFNLKLIYLYAF